MKAVLHRFPVVFGTNTDTVLEINNNLLIGNNKESSADNFPFDCRYEAYYTIELRERNYER